MSRSELTSIRTRLLERLCRPPGLDAQLPMAPSHRQALLREFEPGPDAREAAVLIVLSGDHEPRILMTERRPDLPDHPGQISFPGGRRDPAETLKEAALREAEEEIGLARSVVQVLGRLTPLYIPPSRFYVHPFVGTVPNGIALQPSDAEVARIISPKVDDLLHRRNRRVEDRVIRGREVRVPYFNVEGVKIWGATAMILSELLAVLED